MVATGEVGVCLRGRGGHGVRSPDGRTGRCDALALRRVTPGLTALRWRRTRAGSASASGSLRGVYQLWLILHILGAIGAFGFQVHRTDLRRRRREGAAARQLVPALDQARLGRAHHPARPVHGRDGTLLVLSTGGFSRFGSPWLAVSIVVYIIALLLVFLVQRPTLQRLIALTSGPPGPDGPPAQVPPCSRDYASWASASTSSSITIVVLMVWKPGR